MISKISPSKQCQQCNSLHLRKHHLQSFASRMYVCRKCSNGIWYSDDWEEYIGRINQLLEEFPISQSERDFLEKIRSSTQLHWNERMKLLCIEYRVQYESPHIENLIEEQSEILADRMTWK